MSSDYPHPHSPAVEHVLARKQDSQGALLHVTGQADGASLVRRSPASTDADAAVVDAPFLRGTIVIALATAVIAAAATAAVFLWTLAAALHFFIVVRALGREGQGERARGANAGRRFGNR